MSPPSRRPEPDEAPASPATPQPGRAPLARWLWRSYVRAALVPLFVIEVSFVIAYGISNQLTYERNTEAVSRLSTDELRRIAHREALGINERLTGVTTLLEVYRAQVLRALETPSRPDPDEQSRYHLDAYGAIYTVRDNGGSAVFYSGRTRKGKAQWERIWRTAPLDPLMKDLKRSHPLITQLYFNTFDSYNRIYPYFPTRGRVPPRMDIPSFNFYFEADAAHNPARKVVWTDAYLDPAGSGWLVSAIAPVYRGDFLEAVAGIDVTVDTIVKSVLQLELPWNAYALLVGRDGTLLALPPGGEADFRLSELTATHDTGAGQTNVFKPDAFNLFKRQDVKALGEAIGRTGAGIVEVDLRGERLAAWGTIPDPGWKLVVVAPKSAILAHADRLHDQFSNVVRMMVVLLVAFYSIYFLMLFRRSRAMSRAVAQPLTDLEALITRIGDGDYDHPAPTSG